MFAIIGRHHTGPIVLRLFACHHPQTCIIIQTKRELNEPWSLVYALLCPCRLPVESSSPIHTSSNNPALRKTCAKYLSEVLDI